jgi:hypothetical protein
MRTQLAQAVWSLARRRVTTSLSIFSRCDYVSTMSGYIRHRQAMGSWIRRVLFPGKPEAYPIFHGVKVSIQSD